MPAGIEIYNPATGVLRVSLTTRVGKFSGFVDTNGQQSGTISVPDLVGRGAAAFVNSFYSGQAVFEVVPLPPSTYLDTAVGSISWEYKGNVTAPARFHRISYGWF